MRSLDRDCGPGDGPTPGVLWLPERAMSIQTFGAVDERSRQQLRTCLTAAEAREGRELLGVLCADHHPGYSQPIGGVVAHAHHISPSGVGYDIACGNMAARTNIRVGDLAGEVPGIMDEIWTRISFGIGRKNAERVEHAVIDEIAASPITGQRQLLPLAATQLGTVGSGNHYVDLFRDDRGRVWVGVHFGSRGFGHKTCTGFLALAQNRAFTDKIREGGMDSPPVLIDTRTPLGQDYIHAMEIAGRYAYAGREWVVKRVAQILGAEIVESVHNHHNFAWRETHGGTDYWVTRKGATLAFPGQRGFVGGSMGEISVVLEGCESPLAAAALYSTVHGAGSDPPWVLWTPKKARECAGRCSWAHGSDDGSPRRSSRRRCGSVCGTTAASGRWLGSWT